MLRDGLLDVIYVIMWYGNNYVGVFAFLSIAQLKTAIVHYCRNNTCCTLLYIGSDLFALHVIKRHVYYIIAHERK